MLSTPRCPKFGLSLVLALLVHPVHAQESEELISSPLAEAFGAHPLIWGSKLSPDGNRISSISMHPSATTILMLTDLESGENTALMAGERDVYDISWCDWANDSYLLCGLRVMEERGDGLYVPTTRLISVATDTGEINQLVDRINDDEWQQYQDRILDWMPDDPEHVLIARPGNGGYGVGKANIVNGRIVSEEDVRRNVYSWITDGHGVARLYRRTAGTRQRWYARSTPDADWRLLHERELTDLDVDFSPIGFGDNRNELLYIDRHQGRLALFAMDLADDDSTRLVFSSPNFDVSSVHSLGKYSRVVAATYADDRARYHFFDEKVAQVHAAVASEFEGMLVNVLDEDWNRRFYLLYVSSAEDPGSYYRYDSEANALLTIARAYPLLEGRDLIPMTSVEYLSEDGARIPAYLTAPSGSSEPRPAVILPHGGPSSRDYWGYDFLAQFLAANGFVVLQSNYRGSAGYGELWQGDGGFQGWRRAVADIQAGYEYLMTEGLAAPDRVCIVGWSYGGYAALMTALEHPETYRCVVSIAGVTDPRALAQYSERFVGGLSARTFIGTEDEVLDHGSPVNRAEEFSMPLLLFQGQKDINVPPTQATLMQRALRSARAAFDLIEYDHAEHSITKSRYRTDLLARLARFLDENTTQGNNH